MTTQQYDTGGANAATGDRLGEAAGNLIDQAGQTAEAQVSGLMTTAGDTIGQVAQAIRQSGATLRDQQPMVADVADTAAQRLDDVSTYLRQHDAREVVWRFEDLARRQPAVVLAGGLALGLAVGRFLRSAQTNGDGFGAGMRRGYGADGYRTSAWGTAYGSPAYGGSTSGSAGTGLSTGARAGGTLAGAGVGSDIGDTGTDLGTTNAYGGAYAGPGSTEDSDRIAAIGDYGSTATGYDAGPGYGGDTGDAGADTSGIRTTGATETDETDRGA